MIFNLPLVARDLEAIDILISIPGIIAEQRAAYRETMTRHLEFIDHHVPLHGLASIELALDYSGSVEIRGLDTSWVGHVAATHISSAEGGRSNGDIHVLLSFSALAGLLDAAAKDHQCCLHVFACALGHGSAAVSFNSIYGASPWTSSGGWWHDTARDCILAFASKWQTGAIGVFDQHELFEQHLRVATEAHDVSRGMTDKPELFMAPHPHRALAGIYRGFFVSLSNWLGHTSACGEPISHDATHGMAEDIPGWAREMQDILLGIHHRLLDRQKDPSGLSALVDVMKRVTQNDLEEYYPAGLNDILNGDWPSEHRPSMMVWPIA